MLLYEDEDPGYMNVMPNPNHVCGEGDCHRPSILEGHVKDEHGFFREWSMA